MEWQGKQENSRRQIFDAQFRLLMSYDVLFALKPVQSHLEMKNSLEGHYKRILNELACMQSIAAETHHRTSVAVRT
jgi:hypothetical protein